MRKTKLFSLVAAALLTATTAWAAVAVNGQLPGKFTINASGDQIVFSQGNLQYVGTWQFAENQWDCLGGTQYNNHRDLFGYGTGNNPNQTSSDQSDYSTFTDWGTNAITNGGNVANLWRTMTKDEWTYIFRSRPDAAILFGLGSVNGVNGTILLPDDWELPTGSSFTASTTRGMVYQEDYYTNSNNDNFSHNTYDSEQWAAMEAAGAVFLPAAGFRYLSGSAAYNLNASGYYRATNGYDATDAYVCAFDATNLLPQGHGFRRIDGLSVRLVTTAPVASITTSADVTTNYATFAAALAAWENNSTLKLLADATISSPIEITTTRTLDLNGYGITMTGTDCIFLVQVGGDLTMIDSSPTRSTRTFNVSNHLATLADGGAYSFQGGYLTGGWGSNAEDGSRRGGAVLLKGADCQFTMRGGTIIGNRACFGGGVQVRRGTFVMEGGAIIYNCATDGMYHGGGAVFVDCGYGAQLTLGGTALIEHNYTTAYEYGQVFIGSCADGQLVISGGSPRVINSASTNNLNLGIDGVNFSIMTIAGAMTEDADLSLYVYRTGVLTSGYDTYHHGVDPNTFFSVQNEGYALTLNADGEVEAVLATILTAHQDPQNTSDYYSTFYHGSNKYALPAGTEAYVAARSGDALNLTKIAEGGQVIPAADAVILKANSSSITLTPSDATAVSVDANDLQGTDAAISNPSYGHTYVLSAADGEVGFYKLSSGATIPAHKAYITITGSLDAPRRLRFVFDSTTGVEQTNDAVKCVKYMENGVLVIEKNGTRYNAQGQMIKR